MHKVKVVEMKVKAESNAKLALGSDTRNETGTPVKHMVTTVYILIPTKMKQNSVI